MIDFDTYIRMGEPGGKERAEAWKTAIGLQAVDGVTPTSTPPSTPTSVIPFNENIKKLIEIIGENQLSVKEMLVGMGLKDRPNFLEYTLSPAIKEGYVRMLYPDSPRHPRQKYLLTVKGLAAYKETNLNNSKRK